MTQGGKGGKARGEDGCGGQGGSRWARYSIALRFRSPATPAPFVSRHQESTMQTTVSTSNCSCHGELSKFGFAHNLLQKILGVVVVRGIGVGEFRELYVNRNELSSFQNCKPSLSGVCLF